MKFSFWRCDTFYVQVSRIYIVQDIPAGVIASRDGVGVLLELNKHLNFNQNKKTSQINMKAGTWPQPASFGITQKGNQLEYWYYFI